jgi:hypothetical protein
MYAATLGRCTTCGLRHGNYPSERPIGTWADPVDGHPFTTLNVVFPDRHAKQLAEIEKLARFHMSA